MYRQDLLHILAEAPRTYSQLAYFSQSASSSDSSSSLLTQVLGEIAEFHPPGNSAPGEFRLRKESWAEFNPFFHRMSRANLARAIQNAIEAGWDPVSQLTQLPPPPAGLKGLYKELGSPTLMAWVFPLNLFPAPKLLSSMVYLQIQVLCQHRVWHPEASLTEILNSLYCTYSVKGVSLED